MNFIQLQYANFAELIKFQKKSVSVTNILLKRKTFKKQTNKKKKLIYLNKKADKYNKNIC